MRQSRPSVVTAVVMMSASVRRGRVGGALAWRAVRLRLRRRRRSNRTTRRERRRRRCNARARPRCRLRARLAKRAMMEGGPTDAVRAVRVAVSPYLFRGMLLSMAVVAVALHRATGSRDLAWRFAKARA